MKNARQFCSPILILNGEEKHLDRVYADDINKSEKWVQELLFKHPRLIPVDEIEPAYSGLIPIARELRTPRGPLDLFFINTKGHMTLVETKLWRNPEARRQVVGQIIDYATEISHWSYRELIEAVRNASNSGESDPLISAARKEAGDEFNEAHFTDTVSRDLARGKFLLLIVGDGINEGVERMAEFLQRTPQLGFTLSLVELALFRTGANVEDSLFVQPRVLARTQEIIRTIVEISSSVPDVSVKCSVPETDASKVVASGKRPPPLTLAGFLDELRTNAGDEVAMLVEQTIREARGHGLDVDFGSGGPKLKFEDEDTSESFNFGQILKDGTLRSDIFSWKCSKLGMPKEIWQSYYAALVSLIPGSKRLSWSVKSTPTHGYLEGEYVVAADGEYPLAAPLLRNRDKWFKAIEAAVDRIRQSARSLVG